MDPLSALSIATSIVQFVDFSGRIIFGTWQIYRSPSGLSGDHADLGEITQTLQSLGSKMTSRALSDTVEHERELKVLCDNVNAVAQELLDVLNRIRRKDAQRQISYADKKGIPREQANLELPSKWESCLKALQSVWSQQKIHELAQKLDGFRQQLTLLLVIILREEVYSSRVLTQDNIARTHRELTDFVKGSRDWQRDMANALQRQQEQQSTSETRETARYTPTEIASFGRDFDLRNSPQDFSRYLMASLRFDGIEDRYDTISQRHQQTYEWIFQPPQEGNNSWVDFSRWLESASPLYWVTGKAGSGKSTLMKFVHDDPRTRQHLAASSHLPILTASHFFWNSSIQIQMSQIGLLRTLLGALLGQCKLYATVAFPHQWEAFSLLGLFYQKNDWTWTELERGLIRLLRHLASHSLVFLLIDGLDEYNGDHTDLVMFLKKIASDESLNIKICVSSRPWVIFQDAFCCDPSLQMEYLTMPDMLQYTTEMLEVNRGHTELVAEEPEFSNHLIQQIAGRASGVFLWVVLVVRSLLSGITNGDGIVDLQTRLDSLPEDLGAVFQRMLDQIDPTYRTQASEILQVFRAADRRPTILTLAFADYPDLPAALAHPIEPIPLEKLDSKIRRARRRLESRCMGLLEVSSGSFTEKSRVSYLHRSVKDFLEGNTTWSKITAGLSAGYDADLCLSKSYLMQLKTTNYSSETSSLATAKCLRDESLLHAAVAKDSSMDDRLKLADAVNDTARAVTCQTIIAGPPWAPSGSIRQSLAQQGIDPVWTRWESFVHRKMPQPSSFMNYMIWTGHTWYAKAKISTASDIRQPGPFVPRLRSAIDSPHIDPSLDFVRFLLETGADPNENFRNNTVLQLIPSANLPDHESRMALKKLLISYGARNAAQTYSVQRMHKQEDLNLPQIRQARSRNGVLRRMAEGCVVCFRTK